jgi:hypothetical protein
MITFFLISESILGLSIIAAILNIMITDITSSAKNFYIRQDIISTVFCLSFITTIIAIIALISNCIQSHS